MSSILSGISSKIGSGNVAGIFALGQATAEEYGVFIPNGILATLTADTGDDMMRGLVEIAQEVAFQSKTATAIYCAGVALTNPDAILGMLNNMACNLCGTTAQILDNVMYAVQMQIDMAIDTVVGSIGRLIGSIMDLINAILKLTDTLLNLPQNLRIKARSAAQGRMTADKCMDMVADILSCLLNKYLGQPLMKFQDKIIGKINEFGMSVNQALADEFADLDVVSNYIQQEAFMANKATILTQGLYANFGDVNTAPEQNAAKNAKEQAGKVTIDSNGKASSAGTNTTGKNTPKQDTTIKDNQAPKSEETKKVEQSNDSLKLQQMTNQAIAGGSSLAFGMPAGGNNGSITSTI